MSPFRSERQRKYIYARADEGAQWAKKFVRDAALDDARKAARKLGRKKGK